MDVSPSIISGVRKMWTGAIASITPTAFGFRVPAEKWDRRLFVGVVVDDVADYRLSSRITFYLRDQRVLEIPINVWDLGVGLDYVSGSTDAVLPTWTTSRWQVGIMNANAQNWAMIPRPIVDGALQTGFVYNDGTNTWAYNVLMAPLPLRGTFDRVEWQPEGFTGTPYTPSTLLGVYLGVQSL